ncbi:MAG TPA: FecR family protein, partial [Vicinamibacteria bacterium]|nr:FecR family protein [Vicinamibacteria bacterium]
MRLLPFALILGTAAGAAWADDQYRHGRVRDLEGGVVLQRASEGTAEEAIPNLPFLPGDRVWTDGGGRVEFQFEDGTVLRLDSRSKLDYLAHDDRVVLRLWSGSAWLVTYDGGDGFEIETPTALVVPRERGTYRIDADGEESRLSVFDGEASLESGRRSVDVRAGERSWAVRGEWPEEPRRFDRRAADEFQTWNEERDDRSAWAGSVPSYVPDEVRP